MKTMRTKLLAATHRTCEDVHSTHRDGHKQVRLGPPAPLVEALSLLHRNAWGQRVAGRVDGLAVRVVRQRLEPWQERPEGGVRVKLPLRRERLQHDEELQRVRVTIAVADRELHHALSCTA